MAAHTATILWDRSGPDFLRRQYSREHTWKFDGGQSVPASASPVNVPAPWSNAAFVDPEEGLLASVSSCHMLWFLHMACDAGLIVDRYEDEVVGTMTRNERGVAYFSRITLRPRIVWSGEKRPTDSEVEHLHHLAHEQCFIAASIRAEVVVEPRGS
jgi:organic hydroperoxide reductase OsmC/OhrA